MFGILIDYIMHLHWKILSSSVTHFLDHLVLIWISVSLWAVLMKIFPWTWGWTPVFWNLLLPCLILKSFAKVFLYVLFLNSRIYSTAHLFIVWDGHAGGVLDRVDSYIFTGALAYSFVKIFLPLYGVWHKSCSMLNETTRNKFLLFSS